jgi:hypothetical protein
VGFGRPTPAGDVKADASERKGSADSGHRCAVSPSCVRVANSPLPATRCRSPLESHPRPALQLVVIHGQAVTVSGDRSALDPSWLTPAGTCLVQPAPCLGMHCSADTLRSAHGFPGSHGVPNRGSAGDTSRVRHAQIVLPAQWAWEVASCGMLGCALSAKHIGAFAFPSVAATPNQAKKIGIAGYGTYPGRLNQDVAAGDFEAAHIESLRCRLRRGWRLIASQLPHQRKHHVSVGAVAMLFGLPDFHHLEAVGRSSPDVHQQAIEGAKSPENLACTASYISTGAGTVVMTPYIPATSLLVLWCSTACRMRFPRWKAHLKPVEFIGGTARLLQHRHFARIQHERLDPADHSRLPDALRPLGGL